MYTEYGREEGEKSIAATEKNLIAFPALCQMVGGSSRIYNYKVCLFKMLAKK